MSEKTASNKKVKTAAAKTADGNDVLKKTNTVKKQKVDASKAGRPTATGEKKSVDGKPKADSKAKTGDSTKVVGGAGKVEKNTSVAANKSTKKTAAGLDEPKKLSKGKRIAGIVAVVALVLLGIGIGVACAILNNPEKPDEVVVVEEPEPEPEPEPESEVNEDPLEPEPEITDGAAYQVAAYKPRFMSIPSLGLYSIPIIEVGKEGDGTLGAPQSDYVIAWFYRSALPGQPGATVMDGHGGDLGTGILKTLPRVPIGAEIIVQMGDGRQYTYIIEEKVYKYIGSDADNYMDVAYTPVQDGVPTLTLITCTGAWLRDQWTYDQRLFVRAAIR